MKKITLSKEVRVGIMTIVAIFILYFGLNFLKGVDIFKPVDYYLATYKEVDGLVPSSPVYIKGYKVGQVEEIQYDFQKETAFTVRISVSNDIRIPQGSAMELFDDGLMGGKAIQLVYAPQTTPVLFCESGDTLLSQTGAGLLDQLAGGLMPKIENITNQADSLLRSVRLLVDGGSVQNSLSSIEKTTADLAVSSSALKKMMQQDMPLLIQNVQGLTSDFKIVSGNLKKIDFASTFQNIDVTVRDLNQITRKVNDGEGSVGLLLNDKSLYMNLVNVTNSADELLIDLRNSPKRYVHFSLFGSRER
ncbi:MAG: MlaD family protein [Paludibacter sp.]|nr:MlaD family protein [Paludibacter sp.]MDD4198759.1 MlaD family protein [Paludibacter sp.]